MSEHIQLNDYVVAIKTIHHSNKHHLAANRNQKLDICISPSNDIIITSKRYRDKTARKTHFTSGSVCSLSFRLASETLLLLHCTGGWGGVSHSMHTHKHKKGNRKATLFLHTHTHIRFHRGHTHHLMCDVYFHFAFIMCPLLSPQPEHPNTSISLPENGKSFRFAKALASQTNNADAFPPHRIIHRTRRRAEECHLLDGLAQGKGSWCDKPFAAKHTHTHR